MERGKVEVKIDEMYQLYYRQGHGRISPHKRRAKGKEYVTQRVMLRRYFNKYIGRKCFVYEVRAKWGISMGTSSSCYSGDQHLKPPAGKRIHSLLQ